MFDLKQFSSAIAQIAEEKGISKDKIISTIEMALAAAYKKDYGKKGQIIRAKLEGETGDVKISQFKIVVDESMIKTEEELAKEEAVEAETAEKTAEGAKPRKPSYEEEEEDISLQKMRFNPEKHVMIAEAKDFIKATPGARLLKAEGNEKKSPEPRDEIEIPLEVQADYGRIAAQTAKQVIIQRIREAEREAVYEEFKNKEGEITSGIIQRVERGVVYVDIGKVVGILLPEEQTPREYYRLGQRLRVLIARVDKDSRNAGVILSRADARLVAKLFELEVPEIASGAVVIKAIAREAGARTKITVASTEEGVDPVGSCVGQKGTRVNTIISELGGEKIDVIEWNDNPSVLISHSLAPAKVLSIDLNPEEKFALVKVAEDQLSLAIGRAGQNVRLAVKLTGWKIDIEGVGARSAEAEKKEEEKKGKEEKKEKEKTEENKEEKKEEAAQETANNK